MFLIGAILVFVAAALTLVLIRSRDFEVGAARTAAPRHQPEQADGGPPRQPAAQPTPLP